MAILSGEFGVGIRFNLDPQSAENLSRIKTVRSFILPMAGRVLRGNAHCRLKM
jgi:hypothetical protein